MEMVVKELTLSWRRSLNTTASTVQPSNFNQLNEAAAGQILGDHPRQLRPASRAEGTWTVSDAA